MNHNRAVFVVVSMALLAVLAPSVPADAASFGIRGGVYTEQDNPFVGAELLSHAGGNFYFNPNAEYVFIDSGQFWTFNFDGHYDLMGKDSPYIWIGAGLAVSYFNPEGSGGSDTNANANLLAGIGFRTSGRVVPYIQVKLITSDPSEFVAAGGIRF
jgi:hypothetical protein